METLVDVSRSTDPMLPRMCRIMGVRQETHDTFTLQLEPEKTEDFKAFKPGQFNMLYVFGVGEVPISISGNPKKAGRYVHTTREVGTVTRAMKRLHRGGQIGVRGPFGSHWPVEEAKGRDIVIVAGGIGLAPLRPAIYHILQHRKEYGKILLLYGTRTPDDILFRRELELWRGRFDMRVRATVDRADKDWRGNIGVVTGIIPTLASDPENTVAMVCGPEIMMRYTVNELLERGMHKADIHISMERNMKCAIGFCGHCQLGPKFICKDGPVFPYQVMEPYIGKREI